MDLLGYGAPDAGDTGQRLQDTLRDGGAGRWPRVSARVRARRRHPGREHLSRRADPFDGAPGQRLIPLQVDIGFGDAITPPAEELDFPTLLDFPAPHVLAYPKSVVVAEKFEALVTLGLANSRMKDFYDLWMLAQRSAFDGEVLSQALQATLSDDGSPCRWKCPWR